MIMNSFKSSNEPHLYITNSRNMNGVVVEFVNIFALNDLTKNEEILLKKTNNTIQRFNYKSVFEVVLVIFIMPLALQIRK